jgi:hypothetical protein
MIDIEQPQSGADVYKVFTNTELTFEVKRLQADIFAARSEITALRNELAYIKARQRFNP